ncbi:outer membrane receptor protein involved in Fe transport [Sphingobium sp. B1D7B]|nr:outer membrane receptor protein involved in Fe transport [Sphingobium sp. B1D7B]
MPIAPAGAFSSQFFPDMFSQEVRINSTTDGPFHWLLGGAYQDGSGPQENYLRIPVAGIDTNADNNTITKNWAVYGELGYDLFDGKLRPRVGLRYYHDKRTFEDANTTNTNKKNVTTWRVNLSYVPNDDLTVFATAATGFRPGIVQSQIQADLLADVGIPAGTQTRPESSTNYEAGIKWRSPDRTLNVGLNFYVNKLEDMLTPTPTLDANVSGFSNFGDGTSKGVDIEMRWRTPLDGLTLSAVANINQGKYDTVDPAVQARLPYLRPGTRLVNTLEENARVDATYETSLGGDLNGLFNVAWTYNGNRLQTNGEYVKAYSVYSANIGLRYKAYDLTLFGENLGDYDGAVLTLNTSSIRVTPRTIGLRLRVNYQ